MKTRRAWLAAFAAAAIAVPLTTTSSLASWNDTEWVAGQMQTTTFDCEGGQLGYSAEAAARQVSGSLLGLDLDTVAEVSGVENAVDENGVETWDPASAADLDPGDGTTHTRTTSLEVGVLSGLVGVSLPQVGTGVPGVDVGALAQLSRVSETGHAVGATGLVADTSGIIAIGEDEVVDPPQDSSISLSTLLPGIEGISDVGLQIGAVSALSQIDGCALLREALWDIPALESTVLREYEIAGLDLVIDAPVLEPLVAAVDTTVASLQETLDGLAGTIEGLIELAALDLDLGLAQLGANLLGPDATTPPVIVDAPDLEAAVDPLLEGITDDTGSVTINARDGEIVIDLASVLGGENGLNGLDPNTELTLNDEVVNTLTARIGTLLDSLTTQVVGVLESALDSTSVTVDGTLQLSAQILTLPLQPIIDVELGLDTTLGDLGSATLSVDAAILPDLLGGLLGGAVNLLLSPLLITIENTLSDLVMPLLDEVVDGLFATVTTLGTTLNGLTAPIVTALSSVLSELAAVLSLQVNVQPDQPNAPPNALPYEPMTSTSSGEYIVTALRVGVISGTALNTLVNLATARAGSVTIPPPAP